MEGQAAPGLREKLLEEPGVQLKALHPTPPRDRHSSRGYLCTRTASGHRYPVLRCWLLPKNPQEMLLLEKISIKPSCTSDLGEL